MQNAPGVQLESPWLMSMKRHCAFQKCFIDPLVMLHLRDLTTFLALSCPAFVYLSTKGACRAHLHQRRIPIYQRRRGIPKASRWLQITRSSLMLILDRKPVVCPPESTATARARRSWHETLKLHAKGRRTRKRKNYRLSQGNTKAGRKAGKRVTARTYTQNHKTNRLSSFAMP